MTLHRHLLLSLLALLGALSLGGCGHETAPFAHRRGGAPLALAPLPDSGGVVVQDIAGAPEPTERELREAMVDALARFDIPAETEGSNRRSHFLHGSATVERRGGGTLRVEIAWKLVDAAGRAVRSQPVARELTRTAWEDADPAAMAAIAAAAAPGIAALIQEPAPPGPRQAQKVPLHVRPVAGVPGNAALALRRAMAAALRARNYRVRDDLGKDGLVIAGNVALGKAAGSGQPIRIVWSVLDLSGHELGHLSQSNTVPANALPGGWGIMAHDIAQAAAGGVSELLERLPPEVLRRAGAS